MDTITAPITEHYDKTVMLAFNITILVKEVVYMWIIETYMGPNTALINTISLAINLV